MSVTVKTGNLFVNPSDILVNPVNCVGTMGKGLALEFKRRYPENYEYYMRMYKESLLKMTTGVLPCELKLSEPPPVYIVNFATKVHWRNASKIEDIEYGLKMLVNFLKGLDDDEVSSISIPALGCGLGGLKWDQVKPLIIEYMEQVSEDMDVFVFEPN